MGTLFQTAAFVAAASVIISGMSVDAKDILQSAQQSANLLSKHSLEIALESFYIDHQSYPIARNSQELISQLKKEKYIQEGSAVASDFSYQSISQGQDYRLDLIKS